MKLLSVKSAFLFLIIGLFTSLSVNIVQQNIIKSLKNEIHNKNEKFSNLTASILDYIKLNAPEYTKSSYIEKKYSQQIEYLIQVAKFKLESKNIEVLKSFNLPEIIGAIVVDSYSETGAGGRAIKDYSEKYLESSKIGTFGPFDQPVGEPNTLIWGGNVLEYHKKIIVDGETKGYEIQFDLDILKKHWEEEKMIDC